jgi:ABC-type multidrug transport system ATPase subunit
VSDPGTGTGTTGRDVDDGAAGVDDADAGSAATVGVDEGTALALDGVTHAFGDVRVLDDVSLSLAPGTVTAVVGPNGAGKTTLLRVAAALLAPQAGDVERPDVERPVGYLPQSPAFRPGFTVSETVAFYAALVSGDVDRARVLERAGLRAVRDRRVEALSGGMTLLLGLAGATVGDPPALVLDEPTSGLDPGMTRRVFEAVRALADDGVGVLLASHDLAAVERHADRVLVLDGGRVVADGSPADLRGQAGVDALVDAFTATVETGAVQTGRGGDGA